MNVSVQTSPFDEKTENFVDEISKKKFKSNRGRKKKNEKYINPVQFIDENLIQGYGNVFKLIRKNKKNDENSIVRCELCQRSFRKKSIRSHTISNLHISSANL